MINGITELCMMKADVLAGLGQVMVCKQYRTRNGPIDLPPFDMGEDCEAELMEMPGWGDMSGPELPDALEHYIRTIEEHVEVPVAMVSTGPGREETILRSRRTESV